MQNWNNNYQGCGNYMYNYQRNEYAFVDGIEGARAYQCKPNTMMLLMDSQMPVCYKKQTDVYGKTIALEVFDLVPHIDKPQVEYVTKADFEAFKESLRKEVTTNG